MEAAWSALRTWAARQRESLLAVGLIEGVCCPEDGNRSRQGREVDLSCVIMSVSQRLDEHARVILPCHPAEPTEVIVTENGRNDDPRLHAGDEFGIHRDAGKSAVAVVEGVHLGDEEHHVDSALEG